MIPDSRVGISGLRVTRLCLGTMLIGTYLDETLSRPILDEAEDVGIRFIDLADRYPVPPSPEHFGRTEEIVGRWLRSRRHRFVMATKFGGRVGLGENDAGGSRKHVLEACDASLRRLGIDHIDLYWMHMPDPLTPIAETLEAVDRLIAAGKILYFGVSNFNAGELSAVLSESQHLRTSSRPIAIQPRYNLINREPEQDLLPMASHNALGVIPYNPLAAGMLTGRYRRGQPFPRDSRFADPYFEIDRRHYLAPGSFDVVETLTDVSREAGLTPAQTSVNWLLAQPSVASVIVGASRRGQLRQIADGVLRGLPAEAAGRLSQA